MKILIKSTKIVYLICFLILSGCNKELEQAEPIQHFNTAKKEQRNNISVNNNRLVFKDFNTWLYYANDIINTDIDSIENQQRKFAGFQPNSKENIIKMMLYKPDSIHSIDLYFLAALDKHNSVQIEDNIIIYKNHKIYSVKEEYCKNIDSILYVINNKTFNSNITEKEISYSNFESKNNISNKQSNKTFSSTGPILTADALSTDIGKLSREEVFHLWDNKNGFWFRYCLQYDILGGYNYYSSLGGGYGPSITVTIRSFLEYLKLSGGSWKEAGEAANKSFTNVRVAWDGRSGYVNISPVASISLADVSRSDNKTLETKIILPLTIINPLEISGTATSSVNWSSEQRLYSRPFIYTYTF